MDFKQLIRTYKLDQDLAERTNMLLCYNRVLDGSMYDDLQYDFTTEQVQNEDGYGYVSLHKRRPCVKTSICRVVVDQSVTLLFGEGHFPTIVSDDEKLEEFVQDLEHGLNLQHIMMKAATWGSVGSVALHVGLIDGEIDISILKTTYLTPVFYPNNPKKLMKVVERYKVSGSVLNAAGYDVDDNEQYWYHREFTENAEVVFKPQVVQVDGKKKQSRSVDKERTVIHNLGFCPIVWIKNLSDGVSISEYDGECTFKNGIDMQIVIDYLLSQGSRALKYQSDPLLILKSGKDASKTNSANARKGDDVLIRDASNALFVGPEGDAKLLEINGNSAQAIIDYTKYLRTLALEGMHGHRADPDKMSAATSGRALELMFQNIIWLSSRLRQSYGPGYLSLIEMILLILSKTSLTIKGNLYKKSSVSANIDMSLKWEPWFSDTVDDMQKQANTLVALSGADILSRKTAVENISKDYGITDVDEELQAIEDDQEQLAEIPGVQIAEKITQEL